MHENPVGNHAETLPGHDLAELLTIRREAGSIRLAVGLMFVTWLGINAIWGLTSSSHTVLSSLEASVLPLMVWLGGAFLLMLATTGVARIKGNRELSVLAAILFAYLLGVWIGRYLSNSPVFSTGQPTTDPVDVLYWSLRRLLIALPAFPMLAAFLWLGGGRWKDLPFRFGTWKKPTRLFSPSGRAFTWKRHFFLWVLGTAVPIALVLQATVGFRPISTGRLWPYLLPLVFLAFVNAFSEEILFRGLIQTALIRYLGVGVGLWAQAIFFGIQHWGSSPDLISGLPMAIAISFFGLLWGKATLETGGLGWAIGFHMAVNLAFFMAQFVPNS